MYEDTRYERGLRDVRRTGDSRDRIRSEEPFTDDRVSDGRRPLVLGPGEEVQGLWVESR